MKQVITAKLKLITSKDQQKLLRKVSLAYRDSLNYVSRKAFDLNKCSNGRKLQKETYYEIRDKFKLPSQMACNVPRQVAATYKSLKTKVKQNNCDLKTGKSQKRYKGLDKAPKFVSRTCTLNYGRDYSFSKENLLSIVTLNGRIKVNYLGYYKHLELIKSNSTKIGAAKIWYDKSKKKYYLLVCLELEISELQPSDIKSVIGIDVGQRFLAVSTSIDNQTRFYKGGTVNYKANHYQRVRKKLQLKGTRSATRRLVAFSGRERRFKADSNHCISKQIAISSSLIGLENLTHIRERTNRRNKKKASKKQKKSNRRKTNWSFAELHSQIAYKAILNNSMAVKVDAEYTSQQCVKCGHTDRKNRPNKGLDFRCEACNLTIHADLLGARNIALRTLLLRQDFESTGRFSAVPDVSSVEAKAEGLSRYSELRWSLDTIPILE